MTVDSLKGMQAALDLTWAIAPSASAAPESPDRHGRPLEIDDIFQLKLAGDPQASPDGSQIVVTVQHIDREANEYRAALWLYPAGGGSGRQLTSGQWNDGSPRWSPDGTKLAFVSKRDTKAPQIWILPVTGGEARRITDLENGAGGISWSPDSQTIAFTSLVSPDDFDPEHDVKVITSAYYKFDGKGFIDGKRTHIFTIDTISDGAEPVQLTTGDFEHEAPQWSPSGKDIAFITSRNPEWDVVRGNDVWTIPVSGGEPRQLTPGTGTWGSLAWSPDGTRLALIGNESLVDGYQHPRLYTIGAAGNDLTLLTGDLDRAIADASMSGPNGPAASSTLRWSGDGDAIVTLVSDRGTTRVVRFDASSGVATVLTGQDRHVTGFALLENDSLAISVTDPTTPAEVRLVTSVGEERLTTFNEGWLSQVEIIRPEEFWVESNGEAIQGWILRPKGTTPDSGKVPLILNVHGGPNAQFSNAFFHELQLYAARGFALAYINPRGSVGYGEAFADAITANWGTGDAPDFLTAIDHVVAQGGIDEGRIGITGGSYGGFITNWMLGTTDRFKAAVTDRSISNEIVFYSQLPLIHLAA